MHPSLPPAVTADAFLALSTPILGQAQGLPNAKKENLFKSLFGTTPATAAELWERLQLGQRHDCEPKHLLWGLLFLKCYATEFVHSVLTEVNATTSRKWSWKVIELLSRVNIISYEKRVSHTLAFGCFLSVDGTDCRIAEPTPFSSDWYSHKFKEAGLRYEVGLSIQDGYTCLVNGPYPCGTWPDVNIFRDKLEGVLASEESVITDGGYVDEKCI